MKNNLTHMNRISLSLFLIAATSFMMNGQVIINEYSASNLAVYQDDFLAFDDWVELYNEGDVEVDISGWHISDKESKPTKFQFPEGTIIPANGYKMIVCSGRDLDQTNEIHTNFKLSQTERKDILFLTDENGDEIEMTELIITCENNSVAKMDGEWRIDVSPTPNGENNAMYTRYAMEPTIEQEAGFYEGSVEITISNEEPNSVLRYNTTGRDVTESSPIYDGPILVEETKVIKAKVFSEDSLVMPSRIDFATYFIDEEFTLPVFSVAAEGVQNLANNMDGQNGFSRPIGSVEYFNLDKERESFSYGELNRHGQDSWQLNHRSLDYICRDEMGYTKHIEAELFPQRKRDEYQRLMFRASGDDNYPAIAGNTHRGSTHVRDEYVHTLAQEGGMKLDVRTPARIIVFLNGDYWGVYGLREKIADHDYIGEYYDQGKFDIQFNSTWGDYEQRYGGEAAANDWLELQDFILDDNNDMGDAVNYNMVDSLINTTSLIDWILVNTNTVAADWLQWNTGWWRGMDPEGDHKKWGYIVWDLDATFDYYINYTNVPNVNPDAVPCDVESLFQWVPEARHNEIFLKLLDQNDDFKELYYQRYADMMNTAFSCENMLNTLDSMIADIAPEMPRQVERWGGPGDSMDEWEGNVEILRAFVEERCTLLDDGALECYDELTGPYNVTLMTEPDGIGEIDFNTLDIEEFPWVGDYFGGMKNDIKAKVFDEFEDLYEFSHWESKSGNIIFPDVNSRRADIELTANDTLVAVFGLITSVEDVFESKGFSAYPNPASNQLQLEYSLDQSADVRISMIDALGKSTIISNVQNESAGGKTLQIDINKYGLSAGVYILNIRIDEEDINRKITVIR